MAVMARLPEQRWRQWRRYGMKSPSQDCLLTLQENFESFSSISRIPERSTRYIERVGGTICTSS